MRSCDLRGGGDNQPAQMELSTERLATMRCRRIQKISALSLSEISQMKPLALEKHPTPLAMSKFMSSEREEPLSPRPSRHVTFLDSDSLMSKDDILDDKDLRAGDSIWEEIMKYKADVAERPSFGESTLEAAPLPADSALPQEAWGDITYSDAEDSQSESGRTFSSLALSSVSGSRSTVASLSMSASCLGEDDRQDNITFPSYDDIDTYGQFDELESLPSPRMGSSYPASPNFSTFVSQPQSPQRIEHHEDDVEVRPEPSRHVDYLSHNWTKEDIWASWKHLTSRRKAYANSARLSNALWRVWGQKLRNLETASPRTLNWLKDCDVTWLYGPFAQGPSRGLDPTQTAISEPEANISLSRDFLAHKSILKRRNMSKLLLQRSLVSSSLLKQAAAAVQAQQSKGWPNVRTTASLTMRDSPSRRTTRASSTLVSSKSSSGVTSPLTDRKKHIRFSEQVEQFISIDMKSDDEDKFSTIQGDLDSTPNNELNTMRRKSSRRNSDCTANLNTLNKTIAILPSTMLKTGYDASEPLQAAGKLVTQLWNASKVSPSPSQATLRPSRPPPRIHLGIDDMDDNGQEWEATGAFINRGRSLRVVKEAKKGNLCGKSDENVTSEGFVRHPPDRITLAKEGPSEDSSQNEQPFERPELNLSHQPSYEKEHGGKITIHETHSAQRALSWVLRNVAIETDGDGINSQLEGGGPDANIDMRHLRNAMLPHNNSTLDQNSVVDFYNAHGRDPSLSARIQEAEIWGIHAGAPSIYEHNRELLEEAKAVFGRSGTDSIEAKFDSEYFRELFETSIQFSPAKTSSENSLSDKEDNSGLPTSTEHFPTADLPVSSSQLARDKCISVEEAEIDQVQQSLPMRVGSRSGTQEINPSSIIRVSTQINDTAESPSSLGVSPEDCFGTNNEVNNDVDEDEDEAMMDYGSSASETGSSNGACPDLCNLDHHPDSRQDFIIPILDPMRQALVERVMEEFWGIFKQNWDVNITEFAGASGSSRAPNTTTTASPVSSPLPNQRKRQREDDTDPDDKYFNDPRKPGGSVRLSNNPENTNRFACPFRKHDARRYSMHSHRVCALSSWDSIARVKEHLYRCHRMAIHCKRCWKVFKTQALLDSHMTVAAANICEVQVGHPPDGITSDHEKRLRSRKKTSPSQSDEERWIDIYRLLFPNEEIPSPYFEPLQDEVPMSPESRDLAGYEDYIRRELPRLVRSNIEEVARRDMQPLEVSLIGSLVSIIQDCQDRVFRAYREAQRLNHDIEAPSSDENVGPAKRNSTEDYPPVHSLDLYPERSEFLDTMFQPPIPPSPKSEAPAFDSNAVSNSFFDASASSDMVFSDSGYASEMGAVRDEIHASDVNDVPAIHEIGTEDVQWNNLTDLTFSQAWCQMDPMGGQSNWWSNA